MSLARPRSRRFFAATIAAVLIGAVLISRALIATAPRAELQEPERQARLVEVIAVQPADAPVALLAHGSVRAAQRVALSAQVSGVVKEIAPGFVPGARVAAGDWLLRIDPRDLELAVDRARAELASAEATLAQERGRQVVARADLDLLDEPVADSERALMLREPQLRSAQAAVASARAALAAAQLDLARAEIRAPFDARVLSREIAVGAQVGGAGTMLGELAADSAYWVHLPLPARELGLVELPGDDGSPGSAVEITDTSRPQAGPWPGRVIQLLDEVEAQGRRAQLLVEVVPTAPDGAALLLGSYVQAVIQGRRLPGVYTLDPAWISDGRIWAVRDGRLVAVALDILHRDDRRVLARAALDPGTPVVSSVLPGAVAGMPVRIAQSAP